MRAGMRYIETDPFSRQLSEPEYVLDLGYRTAGHHHSLRSNDNWPHRITPAVLLVSRAADGELKAVEALLGKIGIPHIRIDVETVRSMEVTIDLANAALRIGNIW